MIAAVVSLPLFGTWLARLVEGVAAGPTLAEVFEFPPRLRIPADYPQFSVTDPAEGCLGGVRMAESLCSQLALPQRG